jgi:hypothetical protein
VLANDVTLRITVDRGSWTYRGDVTVSAAATANNTNIVELIDDIKAAMCGDRVQGDDVDRSREDGGRDVPHSIPRGSN